MNIPEKFEELLKEASDRFRQMERVRIVSHYDADGISSAAIALAASLREGKKVHHTIVKQIRPDVVEMLNQGSYENIIFTDLGSGHLSSVNKVDAENIIVLDHHNISGDLERGVHVNPHVAGLEEDTISGAGVTYLFSREVNDKNKDLSALAVVGAIGDIQEENWKMNGLNKGIMKEAVEAGHLEKGEGLRLFGRLSRPVHKALQYTSRPHIPGVSESESGAVQFLSGLDIDLKNGDGSWKKLVDLGEEEKKRLASAIIKKRARNGVEEPGEVFGNTYTLHCFNGRFKDARELSTAMNACGRMEKGEMGVLACIGDDEAMERVESIVKGYKRTLGKLIRSVRNGDVELENKDGFNLLDGRGSIPENFIGTVCSILQSDISEGVALVGISESENSKAKVSIRTPDDFDINVGETLEEISNEIDIDGGGHESAGGGYVGVEEVEDFLNLLSKRLS